MLSISIAALIINDRWMRKTLRDFAKTSLGDGFSSVVASIVLDFE
jgi:hypothetical protein